MMQPSRRREHTLMLRALAVLLLLPTGLARADDTLPRITISVEQRRLWVQSPAGDTIFTAPIAVGSGRTLRDGDKSWRFRTPTGETVVRAKEESPLWVPPDWHYIEVAGSLGLEVRRMNWGEPVTLENGSQLTVRDGGVGVLGIDSVFRVFPPDEEIIIGGALFIPPFGTANRRIAGTLGPYRLRLTNGVDLHGTPDRKSIGTAATHGCIGVPEPFARKLFGEARLGDRVIVTDGAKLELGDRIV